MIKKKYFRYIVAFIISLILILQDMPSVKLSFAQSENDVAEVSSTDVSAGSAMMTSFWKSVKGNGTETYPYQISTPEQLKAMLELISADKNKFSETELKTWQQYQEAFYELEKDISMKNISVTYEANNNFFGQFDGKGYSISDMVINSSNTAAGLFSSLSGTVANLSLRSVEVKKSDENKCAGGIAGYGYNGKIYNCNIDENSKISGEFVGGIVGIQSGTKIEECNNAAEIYGYGNGAAGGIVGGSGEINVTLYSNIKKCSNTGSITGVYKVGGIAGEGNAISCENTGNVSGTNYVGGIVGWSKKGTIVGNYNTGAISGTKGVAGILGGTADSSFQLVYQCYNIGKITGDSCTGGIIGESVKDCTIIENYNVGSIASSTNKFENLGAICGNGLGTGKKNYYLESCIQKSNSTQTELEVIEKTEAFMKSSEMIDLLNTSVFVGYNLNITVRWIQDTGNKNQGYPVFDNNFCIEVNTEERVIQVTCDQQIYYAFLPIKKKGYTLEASNLVEAPKVDGKYYIDFSTCSIKKSSYIAVALEKKDYKVDGFSEKQVVRKYEWIDEKTDREKKAVEKGEKIYQCSGSEFRFTYSIVAYPKYMRPIVSGLKFDMNIDDNVYGANIFGAATIATYYDAEGAKPKKISMKINQKIFFDDDNGKGYLENFIWKEYTKDNSQVVWKSYKELTGKKLKEYAETGTTLLLRFYGAAEESGVVEYVDDVFSENESVYGDPVKVKVPKKSYAKTPKLKIDPVKMTISLKNGMQFSNDKDSWNTILASGAENDGSIYFRKCYDGYPDSYILYTNYKVSSISLEEMQQYYGKTLYVRSLGKNGTMPSDIVSINIPERADSPEVVLEKSGNNLVIKSISSGGIIVSANEEYEYRLCNYSPETMEGYMGRKISDTDYRNGAADDYRNCKYSWKTIKQGSVIKIGSKTTYTTSTYIDPQAESDRYDWKTAWKIKWVKEKWNAVYDGSSTCYLVIRKKGDKKSGALASYTTWYVLNGTELKDEKGQNVTVLKNQKY